MDNEGFNEMFGDFDELGVVFEELGKAIVPVFKGLMANGLTVQEAAALTAAMFSQGMPVQQKPMDDE